ncbi:MAG: Fic family protein [Bacteroidaceae bacterium]|nr:Fic family protein [Bacteroidaceae bacterium]
MMNKVSIRFYNDREVRAVWDEEQCKWWFSATDIVRAINNENDYTKSRNYWKYLKGKVVKEGIQLVSITNHFKFMAPDGKMRKADVLDADSVQILAKHYPNNRARAFLDWFVYSDNSLDGQSKKKAYTLIESGLLDSMEPGTVSSLQQIHAYLFGGLYDFAGQIRTKTIWKDGTLFCRAEYLPENLRMIEQMPETNFDEIVNKYVEMNVAHPFMEGNGRSTRIWLDLIFKKRLKMCVDWSKIDKKDYLEAMRRSTTDARPIKALLQGVMTNRIDDREIFMKGIDYSYYYEEHED